MSDGNIAPPIPAPQGAGGAANKHTEIISLPPGLQRDVEITGEVVSVRKGEAVIRTAEGDVTVKTDLPLQAGQKLNLKFTLVTKGGEAEVFLKLSTMPSDRIVPARDWTPQPALPPLPVKAAVELSGLASQYIQAPVPPEANELSKLLNAPVQAVSVRTLALTNALSETDLDLAVKTLLQLPQSALLPPALAEGIDKLKRVLPLLAQNLSLAVTEEGVRNPALSSLVALIRQGGQDSDVTNLIRHLPQQVLSILQQIMPGQALGSSDLQNFAVQIGLLNAPRGQPGGVVHIDDAAVRPETVSTPKQDVTSLLSKLMDKIRPGNAAAVAQQPAMLSITHVPVLGMVLGQASNLSALSPGDRPPLLLLIADANGQQFVSIAPQETHAVRTPLLPGTVLLAAMDAKAQFSFLPLSSLALKPPDTLMPFHPGLGSDWPALQSLWDEALAQQLVQPDVMALLRQAIPMPSPQHMPGAMLFFLAILKNGLLTNWINKGALEKLDGMGRSGLIAQLGRDLQVVASANADTGAADAWRPLPVPLNVNDQIVRMQWFYRHQYDAAEEGAQDKAAQRQNRKTRFLVDVPKTKLGDIQIDGLVHDKNLDLILRSEEELRGEMQNAIRTRYTKALEISGFGGMLLFQPGRQHYIRA